MVHTRRQVASTRHVAVTNRFVCTREFLDFLQQNFVAATSCKKSNQTVFCVTCRGDKILLQRQRFSQNFSSTLEAICCCEVSPQHVAATFFTCNCWFARDLTAAMLVVKNKSISLLWELNSIFM